MSTLPRSVRPLAATIAILAAGPCAGRAQQFAYLTTLGTDTLALERYERTGDIITGDYATVFGGILVHHYVIHVATTGAVDRLDMIVRRRNGAGLDTIGFVALGDSAAVYDSRSAERRRMVHAPGLFPMFVGVNALEETAVSYARRKRSDSLTIPIVALWANFDTAHFRVLMYAPDSVGLWSRITPGLLKLDAAGHVVRASAHLTTTRTETVRVAPFDMVQVLQSMRDSPAGPVTAFPTLSPRDSTSAIVGSIRVDVTYGRPSLRGRDVFAGGVLGDTVWRTGANEGTQFVTQSDIEVAGKRLPAGRYVLWTRVASDNSRYSLIFASPTGKGCVDYRAGHERLEVPLTVDHLVATVDPLTLDIEHVSANQARFVIRWANTRLSVSLRQPTSSRLP
jgi:hypothetical protein